ncbi:LLM class flavin-dependent oxidoreductase [Streptomyces sp. NBC_01754]|uniref:LLM class flavin-dependent oxidoreductase n=1 Tax=Streptomyces sp. NBC_01754 TaxID=2975930 RepID=UPI002DDAF5AB|nr:LLM class flavin-dependent oxidoreductase [Streptomyces sp. NBC_01754]WSC95989.1 LLM class flavin-dependent oxidoreductase [Streptomyces sp. NBC_01754]
MTDYRRPLEFGYFLEPGAADPGATLAAGRLVDALGFDLLGIQDHPYQPRFLDTWTLLSALGAQTRRVRLFPDVASLPLRPPAVLAKAAASLDLITGGRVELGLGTGAFWDPIAAMGGPRRTPGEAVAALDDAIEVVRLWWSGERSVRYDGTHYSLKGSHPGPVPAHPMGIWLGAYGPKMLDLVGTKADGWLPSMGYLAPEKLKEANRRIDMAAGAAGREPSRINRVYNLMGDRSAAEWIDLLTTLSLEHGMNGYVFSGPADEAALRRVVEEIAPAVRETVAKERRR